MSRRQFEIVEPTGKTIVTLDTVRTPRKALPRGADRSTPRADALARLVQDFIEGEGRETPARQAA